MVKINDITLKNVKHFSGMEDDCGFNANIYYKSQKMGFAMYGADGGETTIRFESKEMATLFRNIRFSYFSKYPPKTVDGKICEKIFPAESDSLYSPEYKDDFKELCCSTDEQFVLELLLLIEREKSLNKFIKKYTAITAIGVFNADVNINGVWKDTDYAWEVPMVNKSLEEQKKWQSKLLANLSKNNKEYRINLFKIYDKNDFDIVV